jgi:hypothetical protein
MAELKLDKFELPPVSLTPEDLAYFQHYYGIDVVGQCTPEEQQIIADFRYHGASAAISNLFVRLMRNGTEG